MRKEKNLKIETKEVVDALKEDLGWLIALFRASRIFWRLEVIDYSPVKRFRDNPGFERASGLRGTISFTEVYDQPAISLRVELNPSQDGQSPFEMYFNKEGRVMCAFC